MALAYPVIHVEPDWVLETEPMGSKDKFWFRNPRDPERRDWLFKYPTPGTGQHWAEKIAFEIACKMPIVAPRVELAIYDGTQGSATLSFTKVRTGETFAEYELFHGNQILAGMDAAYDPGRRFRQAQHTVQRIFESMDTFHPVEFADQCRQKLAEYFVFDALIGNVDRHHENWGILRKRVGNHWRGRLAPSFDHASALGRELQDEGGKQSRRRYMEELGVERYAERAHGPIFTEESEKRGPSPLELVRWCLRAPKYQAFFHQALHKLENLTPAELEKIVSNTPPDWMTLVSKEFVVRFVSHNLSQLQSLAS